MVESSVLNKDLSSYSDEDLLNGIKRDEINNIRDIQYLYGFLYELGLNCDHKLAEYLTPEADVELIDESESVIFAKIDIDNSSYEGIEITSYNEGMMQKLAHSNYDARRGQDFSITHKSGEKSPKKVGDYLVKRFTKWADQKLDEEGFFEHDYESKWIIEELRKISDNEDILDKIKTDCIEQLSDEKKKRLVSVKLKINGEWKYPGEIDVLNKALIHRLDYKSKNKSSITGESSGEGIEYIDNKNRELVGCSTDPLNMAQVKQSDKFPNLSGSQSWKSYPTSLDTSIRIANSEFFLEELYTVRDGLRIYYLPYYKGEHTPEKIRNLYSVLYKTLNNNNLETLNIINNSEITCFSFISMKNMGLKNRIFLHNNRIDKRVFNDILEIHSQVYKSWPYSEKSLYFDEDYSIDVQVGDGNITIKPFSINKDDIHLISTGYYTSFSVPKPGEDDPNNIPIELIEKIMSGKYINEDYLIRNFVEEIKNRESSDYFPQPLVSYQYALLLTLNRKGILTGEKYKTDKFNDESMNETISRKEKVKKFIEESPNLNTPETKVPFLLGCFIGKMANYQSNDEYGRGISTTIKDKYPVSSMNKGRVKQAVNESVEKSSIYASDNDEIKGQLMYSYYLEPLKNNITKKPIEEWETKTQDIKFNYSLGLIYGSNDFN